MSTYIVCKEMHDGKLGVGIYPIAKCQRIVVLEGANEGWVERAGAEHHFRDHSFAQEGDLFDAVNELCEECSAENWEREKEAKDGSTSPE